MDEKKYPLWERPLFLMIITAIGGFMNAYTYMTRNGSLSNMHTGNLSMTGIHLAQGEFLNALLRFLPVLACILGALASELCRTTVEKREGANAKHDWRAAALVVEAVFMIILGLIPQSVADRPVTLFVSFITGYQLCLFRTCMGVAHNTTISTGNIRNVGQRLFAAITKRDSKSIGLFLMFSAVTFSFCLGGMPGVWLSNLMGIKSCWVPAVVLVLLAVWMRIGEGKESRD